MADLIDKGKLLAQIENQIEWEESRVADIEKEYGKGLSNPLLRNAKARLRHYHNARRLVERQEVVRG